MKSGLSKAKDDMLSALLIHSDDGQKAFYQELATMEKLLRAVLGYNFSHLRLAEAINFNTELILGGYTADYRLQKIYKLIQNSNI